MHMRRGLAASAAIHVGVLVLVMALMRLRPHSIAAADQPPQGPVAGIVWLVEPGPAGESTGGGGGGNQQKAPPRRAEQPGREARTVNVAPPAPRRASATTIDHDPIAPLGLSALPLASGFVTVPGAIDALASLPTTSQGPGRGGGAGTGNGVGDGPGDGSGLGPGRNGGTGGDVYHPGNGVTSPIELRHGVPRYTADAMRARVQGAVLVECIVETNGQCRGVRVVRGFNPSFGLNEEAVKAAQEWRFRPGTRLGQAVPVVVRMEITFSLR
jgi:protein TonB